MEIKDIVIKLDKSKIKAGDGNKEGKYPLYTCSPKVDKFYDEYLVDTEAIILSTGGNVVINYHNGKFSYSTDCLVIKTNEDYENKFLYYYLKFKSPEISKMFRGAGLKHLNKNEFFKLGIKPFLKENQIQIIKVLDLINEIIKLKKQQILHYEKVIKSQFVEMFESKQFIKKCLNEISINKGEYGSGAQSKPYQSGEPRYVRITDITEEGNLINNNWVSPNNEKNIEKYILKVGDVLFARTGATVGKTYRYKSNDGYCIYAGYCIKFRLDLKICNPDYLFYFTKTDLYEKWVKNKQRTVAQPNINAKEYGNELKIPIPPIELQNKFAEFVKQIDKQKFVIETNIKNTLKMINSLGLFVY